MNYATSILGASILKILTFSLKSRDDILSLVTGVYRYLDADSGVDEGEGSSKAPWKTLAYAQANAGAGDCVVLRGNGNYGEFNDDPYKTSNANWTVWINEEGSIPVINNVYCLNQDGFELRQLFFGIKIAPAWVDPGSSAPYNKTPSCIYIWGQKYLSFHECEIAGTNKYLTPNLAYMREASYITFERCHCHTGGEGLVYLFSDHITFNYNYVHEVCACLFKDGYTGSSYLTIEGNHAHDAQYDTSDEYGEDATYHGSCIALNNGTTTIRNNIIHDGGGTNLLNFYGDGSPVIGDVLIENNLFYNPVATTCVCVDYISENVIVRNNTIIGKKKDELAGSDMYNNALIICGFASGYDGSGLEIYNNIFVGNVGFWGTFDRTYVIRHHNIVYYGSDFDTVDSMIVGPGKYFESGFFNGDLDLKYGSVPDQVLNLTLLKGSVGINFGDSAQPADSLGTLKNGFIIPDGLPRNVINHDAGCYQGCLLIDPIDATTFSCNDLGDVKPAVVIGGEDPAKFVPNINMSFYDDEYYVNINRSEKVITDETVELYNDKLSQTVGIETDEIYVDKDNRLKFDTVFSSRPTNLTLTYDVSCSPGIEFFKQSDLLPWEVAEGNRKRLEGIAGGYVVYINKKNNKYKTGKILYTLRPFVIDAEGNKEYCDLNYNGTLTIDLPEAFMNTAVYPVRLDPTFGYTTIGGTTLGVVSSSVARGLLYGTHTASTGDTVTALYIYGESNTDSSTARMAVYDVSGGNLNNRTSAVSDITINADGSPAWHSATGLSISLVNGTEYTSALGCDGLAGELTIYYDLLGSTSRDYNSTADLSATWSSISTSVACYSMYAEYTAGGGGGTPIAVIRYHRRLQN